ncbi:patatin-like phospholipase family protein [Neolewinella antarctica]|uniref:NTE family protein n=1 Tax=Neolewinella antarctica TaxID=442734 RepID=A0ABX0XDV1_9BACT|nr:patatin-like phospholipase family protein [Neolewinella antarctica]NJC27491.1 NTE family protein [Neolewinella antarctica]
MTQQPRLLPQLHRIYVSALCLLFSLTSIAAQEDYKVGLVLSGGGARGYAHIGALQVLEEAGVRIDYIGGTSMGSIVGGLYAAGYSADTLEVMLRETDIMAELQDAISRENRTIYEKLYNEHYLLNVSLKNFALQLPAALSDGQRIRDLFTHWTAGVHGIRDFSKLPIPFLCIGTNIETGEAIVIENGLLPDAMRASAALPGVLSPHKMNGYVMTDGGVSNNYPAEEIKNKGMDFVIGLTVEQDPYAAADINSLDKLLLQIAFFQATKRNLEQYEITDIDIKPDLGEYTQLSFDAVEDLIEAGRKAATAQLDTLRAIAALQRERPAKQETSIPKSLNAPVVEISGNNDLSRGQVLSFFEGNLPGKLSWVDFRKYVVALFATGRYTHIDYDFEPIEGSEDEVKLSIRLEESNDFGQQLRLGLHYDQVYRANILFGLTFADFLVNNSLATVDLVGGNRFRYRADYRVNRINGMAFGLRSQLHFADVAFDLDEPMTTDGLVFDQLDFRFSDISAELYWDIRQTSNSFTGIAAEFKYYGTLSDQVSSTGGSREFPLMRDLYFVPRAYLLYDKLDSQNFPMRGFSIDAEARLARNLTDPDFQRNDWAANFDLETKFLFPVSSNFSAGFYGTVGFFADKSSLPFRYYLGSNNANLMNNFKAFPSLELGRASGNNLLMGQLFGRLKLGSHHFTAAAHVARLGFDEDLPTSVDRELLAAARVTYGFSSPLGPIELTFAQGNEGGQLYFNLGYWF